MTPPHITQEQADEFAIGALEPEVARLLSLHIDDCVECRGLVVEAERVAAALTLSTTRRAPPERLKRKVLRSAGITRPGPFTIAMRVATAGAGLAAVAVAIAALVGMFSLRGEVHDLKDENDRLQGEIDDALAQKVQIAALSQRLSDSERASEDLRAAARGDRDLFVALLSPESVVADIFPVNGSTAAVGRLVWDQEQLKVWFVASHLDRLPAGQTYQLWLSADGRFTSLGTFNSDETGFARYQALVPLGLGSYESAVVTVEAAPGAPERQGTSVFVTDLSQLHR